MQLTANELKVFLNEKYETYNRFSFVETDPISVPHCFTKKEDIEIAAFLTATIAWGQRTTIINNATKLIQLMDNSPHAFITSFKANDLKHFQKFVHRTFNGTDTQFFMMSLQHIYKKHGGLENVFVPESKENPTTSAIMHFRKIFFSPPHPYRSRKHVSDPSNNSSAKRLCMFLRWMVRNDKRGVDFGLWNKYLKPKNLMCPLDVHSGNVARKLHLLNRSQNDWKAVTELTDNLKKLDKNDPVKYDFALFGLGAFEGF